LSKYGQLVDDMRKAMLFLRSFKVAHIKSTKNKAAHGLAKEAITRIIDLIWLEDIHSIIYDIVRRKCSIDIRVINMRDFLYSVSA
jgi:hypothetical protein